MRYVVDTHALLWFLADSPRLGPDAGAILDDPRSELFLPAIALAEACWIVERGRVQLRVDEVLHAVEQDPRITLLPLDFAAIERSAALTAIPEMHDRQIVSAALLLAEAGKPVALLTRDETISASGLVHVLW
jgi:PIN domain nuclease of toxin-antitoxin system